jgi:CheY-like chemotaxis protein
MSKPGKFHSEKMLFLMQDVIDEMDIMFGPYIEKKGLFLLSTVDEQLAKIKVEGDACKLKQSLMILVGNAVKFTRKGGVELIVTPSQQNGNTLEIKILVKDTGPGIDAERLQTIFSGESWPNSQEGNSPAATGFGLPICKRLVELQRGTISATSRMGEGSEFELTIPFTITGGSKVGHSEMSNERSEEPEAEKEQVLVVDDDEMSMLLISNILEKHSIPFITAGGGEEAYAKLKAGGIFLVFTDINMPGFSGTRLLEKIRSGSTGHKTLPVVAITSNQNEKDVEAYLAQGFDKVLQKPYAEEELLSIVSEKKENIESATLTEKQMRNSVQAKKNKLSFSTDQLEKISNSGQEFVRKMLNKFMISAKENSETMVTALGAGDHDMLMNAAHKSIPSYHMLGLQDLVKHLQRIEASSRDKKELGELPGLVKTVHDRTTEVIDDIRDYLEVPDTKTMIKNIP